MKIQEKDGGGDIDLTSLEKENTRKKNGVDIGLNPSIKPKSSKKIK